MLSDKKIYFASPWFTKTQAEREERIKRRLKELGFNVWSPKDNCNCSPVSSKELRKKVFDDNCNNIEDCDILFAITDEKDMGTVWEAGFANGLNKSRKPGDKQIKIVYYCETLGPKGQFNLMLAQSGDIVVTDFKELDKLPELIERNGGLAYVGIVE